MATNKEYARRFTGGSLGIPRPRWSYRCRAGGVEAHTYLTPRPHVDARIRDGGDQGRHTTSHRQLILLPGGGLMLDTPGFREVGLVDADDGVSVVFDDIEQLMGACKFGDCRHEHEPGCAITAALASGELERARWEHFQKLAVEMAATQAKAELIAKNEERRRFAAVRKGHRAAKRDHKGSR